MALGHDKIIVWFRLPDRPLLKTRQIPDSRHLWKLQQTIEIIGIHEMKL